MYNIQRSQKYRDKRAKNIESGCFWGTVWGESRCRVGITVLAKKPFSTIGFYEPRCLHSFYRR